MFGNNDSFVDKLKSLDVYRKLPKEYLQPTFMGAVCTYSLTHSIRLIHHINGHPILKRTPLLYDNQNKLRNAYRLRQRLRHSTYPINYS